MASTVNKHVRIDADVWKDLDMAARDRDTTANRLLCELATQWLRAREWPATDVQVQVARASLFTAQAIAGDMAAAGRGKEIERIRRYISTIVPDPAESAANRMQDSSQENKPPRRCSSVHV